MKYYECKKCNKYCIDKATGWSAFFNLPQLDNGKCPFCNSNVKEVDVQPLYPQEDVKEALAVRVLRFLNKEDYEPRM
jgi:hypothetical protein